VARKKGCRKCGSWCVINGCSICTGRELAYTVERLERKVDDLKGDRDVAANCCYEALQLLENPVFPNDRERALEILREGSMVA
jgi:hypothetical protein